MEVEDEGVDAVCARPDMPPNLPELIWDAFIQYATQPRKEDGMRMMIQKVPL